MLALAAVLAIILVLAVVIGGWFISTQRQLVRLDENCNNSLSQIAVQLNSRWDALLNIARTALQYSKHESETLIKTIQARRGSEIKTAADVNAAQSEFSSVLSRLMAVSEAYPELKANALYEETMRQIKVYEENVRMSRMVYNDSATRMNRYVRQWPSSFVANTLNFAAREYLKIDDEAKTDTPVLFGENQA